MTTLQANQPLREEAHAQARCTHCGLPVPAGLIEPQAEHQFCCHGCQTVYAMLHEHGLAAYYRIRESDPNASVNPRRATTSGGRFDVFADAAFDQIYCKHLDEHTRSVDLVLEGVHCAACVWLIEKLPRVAPGVIESRLSLRDATARLRWDSRSIDLPAIARALDSLGYAPHPAQGNAARRIRTQEDRRYIIRMAVAGACAGNLMLIAFALYAGMFSHMEAQYATLFRYLSMGIGLVSLLWPGSTFLRGALAALRTRTAHLDLPIALALVVGGAVGTFNVITGRGDIYFDTLGTLIFLLLIGRFIQHRQQRRAADALELLFSLTPGSCRRIAPGSDATHEVPIEALQPGDIVEVRANETFPADGVIVRGETRINQALLTGESEPTTAAIDTHVAAGAINVGSAVRVRVESTGAQTRIGRLMALVEQFATQRSPAVQLADRIAGIFVLVLIALAAVTLTTWLFIEPGAAFDHTVALLIVACPCALGLATPLTFAVAIGSAARRDILIKGGDTLERLAKALQQRGAPGSGTLLLDKTGTLTVGRTRVARWHGPEHLRPIVAAIEQHAMHHIAAALREGYDADTLPPVTDVTPHAAGITAMHDSHRVTIGSAGFIASLGITLTDEQSRWIDACRLDHLSPVLIAVGSQVEAVACCGDVVRDDSPQAVKQLRGLGLNIAVLSGDDPAVVQSVASRLAIDSAIGAMGPEQKVAVVKQHAQQGPVVMVGDGVNDAAAFAAADVGIAVHGGAEAALSAADVYLARPGLGPITELCVLARRTMRAVRRSIGISIAYNLTFATLAMLGLINPLVAAVLMPISSFTVLSLALQQKLQSSKTAKQQMVQATTHLLLCGFAAFLLW